MPKFPFRSPVVAAGLAVAMISCGGEGLVLPDEGQPAAIVLLEGDGRSGRVGETLPLVLQVTDLADRPVVGAMVEVEMEGAEPRPGTVETAGDGRATLDVLLGPEVGPAPGAARVLTPDSEQPVQVEFTVNALAASAAGLSLYSGDDQIAAVGQSLVDPLVVQVTDAFGNPIAGIPITWTAVGGGSLSATETSSDETGRSSVTRVLGATAGEQSTLAQSDGLAGSPVVFSHTATAGNAAGVSIASGNDQSGVPGSALAQPLVVQVNDGQGNPVNNAAVTWVVTGGGGSLDPATSNTDASGRASSSWTLGAAPGVNAAEAVVSGVGQVTFRATGVVGGPNEIRIASGNDQTGQVGQRLGADLLVLVLDERDNPVAGANVAWQVRSGGGGVDPATATTDAAGRASARWTLGSAPGANSVEAAVPGAGSVTFQATATTGAPSALGIATQPPAGAEAGVPLTRQPVIQLRDAAGNNVAQGGVAVTAAIATGGGSLGGTATRTTDAGGRATFTDLRINGAIGAHTIIFAASGYTSVTSEPIDVGQAATTTQITSDTPEPSPPNSGVTVSFTVTSAGGTPTGTVTVTADGGPESCSADAAAGSCVILLTGEADRELTASYGGATLFAPSSDTEPHDIETPANVAPSFTPGPDQAASVAAGTQTVAGWATALAPGPASEAGQTVEFVVQVLSGAEFFAVAPTISPDGTLTYTPGAPGSAQVEVRLRDNGGTANGGSDTSGPALLNFTFSP